MAKLNGQLSGPTKRFTISVDFGTTYSAVAFTITRAPANNKAPGGYTDLEPQISPSDLFVIDHYPGAPSGGKIDRSKSEVPTDLYYDGTTIEWGYQVYGKRRVPSRMRGVHLSRFKLLLDNTERTEEYRRHMTQLLRTLGKSSEDIITDFLTPLLAHTRSRLVHRYRYQEDDLVDLVATVPAIWDTRARRIMERAVERAARNSGLSDGRDVFLVSEPEAAAAYISEIHTASFEFDLQEKETFIICDAGGGTVDLITYTIENLSSFQLTEAVKGDGILQFPSSHFIRQILTLEEGKLCGSSYVNEGFVNIALEKLNKADLLGLLAADIPIRTLVDTAAFEFEHAVKPKFDGEEDAADDYILISGLRDNSELGFVDSCMILTSDLLRSIFLPVIKLVLQLIQEQIEEAKKPGIEKPGIEVKKVLLVGGFAGSLYLEKFLQQALPACEIIVPTAPDTAIARGGIIRFWNQNNGPWEIMRTNYAFDQHEEYNPSTHKGLNVTSVPFVTEDDVDGKRYVRNCLNFFVKAGEKIPPTGKKFEFKSPLVRTVPSLDEDVEIWLELFASNERADSMKNHFPKDHPKNKSCESQGTIRFIISSAELQKLQPHPERTRFRKKARKYFTIEYSPVITIRGRNLRYELWFKGEKRVTGELEIISDLE